MIEAVNRQVEIPPDAEVISLEGRVIHPGFIESYWEISPEGDAGKSATNGQEKKKAIIHHWNERVHPSRSVLADMEADSGALAQLRSLGFTAAHLVSDKGLFRGQTAVIHLSTWSPEATIRQSVTQSLAFDFGRWRDRSYPNSLLGAIALLRQTLLDAQWYHKAWGIYQRYPQYNERPEVNADLAALAEAIANNTPFLCATEDELASLRAGEIATEFGIPLWVAGNGYEYRRLQALRDMDAFFIIPLSFPEAPEVATLEDELQVSLAELRHWDQAPDNPRRVHEAGIDFALTSSKLKDRTQFKHYLARAIERGFDAEQALAALTTIPAERLGLSESHGKIAEGYVANLVVTDGNYFTEDSKVEAVWIKGREYRVTPKVEEDFRGEWRLSFPVDSDRS
ncbi:MAG: amidohydrolase family protein, partial [Fidelibacterota bacterium]